MSVISSVYVCSQDMSVARICLLHNMCLSVARICLLQDMCL